MYHDCESWYRLEELKDEIYDLEEKVGNPPYYLVGLTDNKREYLGVFLTARDMDEFIDSCRLKGRRGFKKSSPIGKYNNFTIERFYVPEHVPVNPKFKGK